MNFIYPPTISLQKQAASQYNGAEPPDSPPYVVSSMLHFFKPALHRARGLVKTSSHTAPSDKPEGSKVSNDTPISCVEVAPSGKAQMDERGACPPNLFINFIAILESAAEFWQMAAHCQVPIAQRRLHRIRAPSHVPTRKTRQRA